MEDQTGSKDCCQFQVERNSVHMRGYRVETVLLRKRFIPEHLRLLRTVSMNVLKTIIQKSNCEFLLINHFQRLKSESTI